MAVIFAISVFCLCLIFNYQAFIFCRPEISAFWEFYLPKLSISVALSGFVFLMKRKYWTVILSIVLGLWTFANLVYLRSSGRVLDAYSFTMAGNMRGFWDSVISFVYRSDAMLLIPTVLVILGWRFVYKHNGIHKRSFFGFAVFVLSALLLHTGDFMLRSKKKELPFNPFTKDAGWLWGGEVCTSNTYVAYTSIIHSLIYGLSNPIGRGAEQSDYMLTKSDENRLKTFVNHGGDCPVPKGNLVIILVESLEGWALSPVATPNLCRFIDAHTDHCLTADKVKRQTAGGVSGDGQMIINTGLLPVMDGAACFRFPENKYPSLSSLYDSPAIFFPGGKDVWNQSAMDKAYGINVEYGFDQRKYDIKRNPRMDDAILSSVCENCGEHSFILALTFASHTPFRRYAHISPAETGPDMPEMMRDYLNCLHYTDSCMGKFLNLVDTNSTLRNSTIVITGDHSIFDMERVSEFNQYLQKAGADYEIMEGNTALVIYSPSIREETRISAQCYQMDIYPTVLNLIGCGGYYWRGFGIDLLNPDAGRPISEEDAYILSDRIIRSDYFNTNDW